MRAVIQRVKNARVTVKERVTGEIGSGILMLLGIGHNDNEHDVDYLVNKSINLRIFDDEQGKMNLSLVQIAGEILLVSQFTLFGDCRKGRRPNFTGAAEANMANKLYRYFIQRLKENGIKYATGEFQARMEVELINHGPITLLLDSKKEF